MKRVLAQLVPVAVFTLLLSLMFSCGHKDAPQSQQAVQAAVDSAQKDIDFIVDEENSYRAGLSQAPLTSGLSCTLSTITGGHRIQPTGSSGVLQLTGVTSVATFLYKGSNGESFNHPDSVGTEGVNVLPGILRPLYVNLYTLSCTGYVVVLDSNFYSFESKSDDASLVYVDNALLLDNDNSHGVTTKNAVKYLRRGLHQFKVQYAQSGGGNQALVITVNGKSIAPKFYAH